MNAIYRMVAIVLGLFFLLAAAAHAQVVGQGEAATTSDANAWPFKIVFGGAHIDPRDVSDRGARLLGVVFGSQGQQLKQTATNFNLASELFSGGTVVPLPTALGAAGGFKVEVLSGAGGDPSGCGSTNFETNAAMPSTDTVVTATATCLDWMFVTNIGTQTTTVIIKDNAGTPFTYVNSIFVPPNSQIEWHPNGKIFTGGIRVQAGAASVINYAFKGKQ